METTVAYWGGRTCSILVEFTPEGSSNEIPKSAQKLDRGQQ